MNKIFTVLMTLALILFSIAFWWFGPRRENLIQQCSREIFDGKWTISGEDERINPLERVKTMQETCLLDKGIIK